MSGSGPFGKIPPKKMVFLTFPLHILYLLQISIFLTCYLLVVVHLDVGDGGHSQVHGADAGQGYPSYQLPGGYKI